MQDSFGVEVKPTDSVVVLAYGYGARLVDTGITRPIIRLNRERVTIKDVDGRERNVHPRCLGVVNRETGRGYEGNRA